MIIDVLKNRYSLPLLLKKMYISKSSYYYQKKALSQDDKYTDLRIKIRNLFDENKKRYGYQRIHALLTRKGIIVSEKIIRRIMKDEGLVVKVKRAGKYNSYKGETTPAVDNVIHRDFSTNNPNEKWLTDVTEFALPAGKVYLSPIVDCFDGMIVTWNISTTPDSNLVNTMLLNAINKLNVSETPLVHSDRGAHYRWPAWIKIMNEVGLIRSISKRLFSRYFSV